MMSDTYESGKMKLVIFDQQEAVATALLERMMERDPSTIDVVIAMRSRGRSWNKIRQCFRSVITGLDIE